MKSLRKALLPGLIAAGFLVFLGAVGSSAPTASADVTNPAAGPGDVCSIIGPAQIKEGETAIYRANIQSIADAPGFVAYIDSLLDQFLPPVINPGPGIGGVGYAIAAVLDGTTTDVDLDDSVGDSDITSIDKDGDGDTEVIPATDSLNAIEQFYGTNDCGLSDAAAAAFLKTQLVNYILITFDPAVTAPVADNDGAGPNVASTIPAAFTPGAIADRAADVIAASDNLVNGCTNVANDFVLRLVAAGYPNTEVNADGSFLTATERGTILFGNCIGAGWTLFYDLVDFFVDDRAIIVDVTCEDAGEFELSFAPEWSASLSITGPNLAQPVLGIDFAFVVGEALSIDVRCGSDVDSATITASPTSVEINPSYANVAHSLITVTLLDREGDNANAGDEVTFITDKCSIESSTVDTEDEFEAAASLFGALNALVPSTAAAIESSVYATTAPDSASRQQEEVNSFVVTSSVASDEVERTVAAVVLHCDPVHAPGVTPGDAKVTAYIERGDDDQDEGDQDGLNANNDDLVVSTTVKVVGPPAANGLTVTASPASLACGEKAQISVDVKDSIGQPVSDHTLVEAVTNAGGVLGGTGAVAGQAGLVSPVSSTVAETFGGKVTLYLLTSTAHVGKYEVLITTGGGGGVTGQLQNGGNTTNLLGGLFTTAPISAQVTIECTVAAAAPAPTVAGPRTGQGITPPSTGDAGLASSNSSSLVLVAVATVAALAAAGFAVKLAREEN